MKFRRLYCITVILGLFKGIPIPVILNLDGWMWRRLPLFCRLFFSNLVKFYSFMLSISVIKLFWNFAQRTTVTLSCSVQNFKTICQLRNKLEANKIMLDIQRNITYYNGLMVIWRFHGGSIHPCHLQPWWMCTRLSLFPRPVTDCTSITPANQFIQSRYLSCQSIVRTGRGWTAK